VLRRLGGLQRDMTLSSVFDTVGSRSKRKLSGLGVTRKPGATTAHQHTEGKQSLVMTDGKVTGAAAANNGKTYSTTLRTTAPGQFIVDVKND
jgi:hypothetical protein